MEPCMAGHVAEFRLNCGEHVSPCGPPLYYTWLNLTSFMCRGNYHYILPLDCLFNYKFIHVTSC